MKKKYFPKKNGQFTEDSVTVNSEKTRENPLEKVRKESMEKVREDFRRDIYNVNSKVLTLLPKARREKIFHQLGRRLGYNFSAMDNNTERQSLREGLLNLSGDYSLLGIELSYLIGSECGWYIIESKGIAGDPAEERLTRAFSGSKRNRPVRRELKKVAKKVTSPNGELNVRAIRENLGMSQSKFSETFEISLDTLQSWEQGINKPRGPAQIALMMIALEPRAVQRTISLFKAAL